VGRFLRHGVCLFQFTLEKPGDVSNKSEGIEWRDPSVFGCTHREILIISRW